MNCPPLSWLYRAEGVAKNKLLITQFNHSPLSLFQLFTVSLLLIRFSIAISFFSNPEIYICIGFDFYLFSQIRLSWISQIFVFRNSNFIKIYEACKFSCKSISSSSKKKKKDRDRYILKCTLNLNRRGHRSGYNSESRVAAT